MLSSRDRIMDVFYKNYPDLDKHSADRNCVAAVLREAVQCVLPDSLEREEHNPSGKFVAWKYELLKIADELEAL